MSDRDDRDSGIEGDDEDYCEYEDKFGHTRFEKFGNGNKSKSSVLARGKKRVKPRQEFESEDYM